MLSSRLSALENLKIGMFTGLTDGILQKIIDWEKLKVLEMDLDMRGLNPDLVAKLIANVEIVLQYVRRIFCPHKCTGLPVPCMWLVVGALLLAPSLELLIMFLLVLVLGH